MLNFISYETAAETLGVSIRHLDRLVEENEINVITIFGSSRWRNFMKIEDVERLAELRKRETCTEPA